MGRFLFGCDPVKTKNGSEAFVPVIVIEQDDTTITFQADIAIDCLEEARRFVMGLEKALRGERKNFRYSKDGDLN